MERDKKEESTESDDSETCRWLGPIIIHEKAYDPVIRKALLAWVGRTLLFTLPDFPLLYSYQTPYPPEYLIHTLLAPNSFTDFP